MAFRRNISPLSLVPSSPKDFVDRLDQAMEAQQNLDTTETIWPTSYKILIHRPGNILNKLHFKTSINLLHIWHHGAIIGESQNKVIQVQHVNRGITLPVLEGLEC